MLYRLQWDPLAERRAQAKLCMLYKAAHSLVTIPVTNYLRVTTATTAATTRGIVSPTAVHSFFPDAARLWNKLPCSSVTARPQRHLKPGSRVAHCSNQHILYISTSSPCTRHHLYSCTSLSSLYTCVQYSTPRIMHNTWKKKKTHSFYKTSSNFPPFSGCSRT